MCKHDYMGYASLHLHYISPHTLYKQRSLNSIKQGYILQLVSDYDWQQTTIRRRCPFRFVLC